MSLLYIIGGPVPNYAKPETFGGVQRPQPSEEVSLTGEPIANGIFPTAIFTWSKISLQGFRFWSSFVGKQYQSVEINDIILFDPAEGQNMYQSHTLYESHSAFISGILWKIQKTPETTTEVLDNNLWLSGSITLRITRLREGKP